MLMKNFDKKKRIGIPAAIGLWCISKAFMNYTLASVISLFLSIFIFCFVLSDEYFEARTSIKIFTGIGIIFLLLIMMVSLLPNELGLDSFEVFIALVSISVISFIIAFCIRLKDDVILYINLKKMNKDSDINLSDGDKNAED